MDWIPTTSLTDRVRTGDAAAREALKARVLPPLVELSRQAGLPPDRTESVALAVFGRWISELASTVGRPSNARKPERRLAEWLGQIARRELATHAESQGLKREMSSDEFSQAWRGAWALHAHRLCLDALRCVVDPREFDLFAQAVAPGGSTQKAARRNQVSVLEMTEINHRCVAAAERVREELELVS